MRIVSWNINALRAHEKSFRKAMRDTQADIFCLQEIRVREDQMTISVKGYHSLMNPADASQYYGTGVFMRNDIHPLSVSFDFPLEGYDYQGRIIAMEFDNYVIINSYWPFSAYDKNWKWLKYRMEWNEHFQTFVHTFQARKPVIICGDMNIVRESLDAFDGNAIKRAGCFYPEEHTAFDHLLETEHLVDSFRALHSCAAPIDYRQNKGIFTTWSYSKDDYNRANNLGFRIDYFLVSEDLLPKIASSDILDDIHGSDHCPISLDIDLHT